MPMPNRCGDRAYIDPLRAFRKLTRQQQREQLEQEGAFKPTKQEKNEQIAQMADLVEKICPTLDK